MGFSRALVSVLPLSIQRGLRRLHYSRKLSAASLGDECDLQILPQVIRPGMTVLDVGANFGLYSRFLSELVGETGKVFSFEPISDIHEVLANNVKSLALDNVTVLQIALSNESGTAEMRIPQRSDGSLNHYESSLETEQVGGKFKIDRVEMETLDTVAERCGMGQIDFIKCDVEGHEIAVLEGAVDTIRRCRPVILLEVNQPLSGDSHGEAVREWFESTDYRIFVLEGDRLRAWEPGIDLVNYLFVPMEKAENFASLSAEG